MKTDKIKKLEPAIVALTEKGGQGVLVGGELVLTAAHCVRFSCDGEMAFGEYFMEPVETADGTRLKLAVLAVEPVHDIAVLGSPDDQEFPEEAEAFDQFCQRTKPVRICERQFARGKRFIVYVRNHEKHWINGTAELIRNGAPILRVETKERIQGGSSGGPVVNEAGQLVGLISWAGSDSGMFAFAVPRPHLVLPVWVMEKIQGD